MIVSSTFTEGAPQVDGRRYVKERHTDDLGEIYDFEWLGSQAADLVLSARAAKLTQLLSEQRAAEALVAGTLLPLTKLQFRELFTAAERQNIDDFRASLEGNGGMPAAQKKAIRTGYADFFTYVTGARLSLGAGPFTGTGEKGDHLVMFARVADTVAGGLTPSETLNIGWDEI